MPDQPTLESLFSRACDGSASADEWHEMAAVLRTDRVALDAWIRYADLHASLATGAGARRGKVVAFSPEAQARRWPARIAALAAAIVVLAGLVWFLALPPMRNAEPAATVEIEVLEVRSTDVALVNGQRAQISTLRFENGSLRFRLSSGAVVAAVGPVEMQLLDPMRVRVRQGKVTADVGERAKGFVVETANATVVDLGTTFGVDVGPAGETDVVVFAGKVEVHEPRGGRGALLASLTEGQAMRVGKKRRESRIECVFIERGREEWATRGPGAASGVIADVRDNLADRNARACYRVAVGGMTAGVTLRRTHPLRWRPAEGDRLPDWLEGADVVDTTGAEAHPADFQMTVTLARPATLYVFNDERQPVPAWLRERFTDTGERLLLERASAQPSRETSAAKPFSVWKMDVLQPGPVTLGAQWEPGQPSQGRVYRLAAKAFL